ncbi:MAG TPA: UvrD-helicase domain-containing protein [Solirubrobacteraceae bacterium]|nr:UvrD-helicase domain-containing protein [Solirubrobacteraceae bacterium]
MSARRAGAPQRETLPGIEAGTTIALAQAGAGELTPEQEQAVSRRAESLAVSAAAGSGKTSVLVERFVRAVREDGVAPGRILAITFTERAAGELRGRVRARLLELGERQAARDTEAAFVGTFHGFCARLLRAHPLAAGLDPDFKIVDEGQAARLRALAFQEAVRGFIAGGDDGGSDGSGDDDGSDDDDGGRDDDGIGDDGDGDERAEAVDLLAAYGIDRVRSMLERVYLELRSTGQRFPRLPRAALAGDAEPRDVEAARACELLDELLERFGRLYERGKRARARVDFDDLELLAQELLSERESLRAAWSERFELLMVDEFQDTNRRQLAIVRALDRGNLLTVGDEFQSIYGFRHADVRLFRERRAELRAREASLSLTRNFRSRAPLLAAVNAVFGERFVEFEALRAGREQASDAAGAGEPAVELLLTDAGGWSEGEEPAASIAAGLPAASPWRQAEARLLAERVAELVRDGRARAGEVVVLLRASGDIEVFERALQLQGLRTLAAVGAFWGGQQVGDLIAYVRALANPLDEVAFYGLLASPIGGCSRDCLALLAGAAQAGRRGAWETALGALAGEQDELAQRLATRDRDALARICRLLVEERAGAAHRTIAALVERAIDASGYRGHVLSLDWGERRLANVQKLLRLARRFEAEEGRDLRAFLDHAERLAGAAAIEPDAPVDSAEPDAVRLMTAHAAKGLEFPVVCVADLGRQPNSRTPDLLVDEGRIGIRLMRLDGGESAAALDYERLCAERRAREAEEEDRVFYVAMTRARELLVLSGAIDFARWTRLGPGATPISWLAPALVEELPARLASGELASEEVAIALDRAVRVRLASPATPPQAPAAAPPGPVEQPPLRAAAPVAEGPPSVWAPRPAAPSPARARASERMSSLSYSSLTELERCGYRYYLERVLGLAEDRARARAEEAGSGLEARARGTLVHRLMELLDFAVPRAPSPRDVARSAAELGLRVGALERSELAELIATAARAAPSRRIARAESVRREHPFAFSLGRGEPLITGVIDLLAVEAGGARLVLDYKSDRVAPDVELEALVEREYGIQRLLYALAVLRDGAASVEIVHWFLERGEWVAARYAAAGRAALEGELQARIASAREQPFVVSAHPHRGLCLTCPGRGGLCSWGEQWTMRERPDEAPLQDV